MPYRIFWLVFVALSWYASSLLIAAQYDAYLNNPISFVVETTYKDWNTYFPAVAVCENDNSKRAEEISDRWIKKNNWYKLEYMCVGFFFQGLAIQRSSHLLSNYDQHTGNAQSTEKPSRTLFKPCLIMNTAKALC